MPRHLLLHALMPDIISYMPLSQTVPPTCHHTCKHQAVTHGPTPSDQTGTVDAILDKVTETTHECQPQLDEMDTILFLPLEDVDLEVAKAACRQLAVPPPNPDCLG